MFIYCIYLSRTLEMVKIKTFIKISSLGGLRSHYPQIKSLVLYRLSYERIYDPLNQLSYKVKSKEAGTILSGIQSVHQSTRLQTPLESYLVFTLAILLSQLIVLRFLCFFSSQDRTRTCMKDLLCGVIYPSNQHLASTNSAT